MNASNARLLTQLILAKPTDGTPQLDPTLPSMAEALAVMAGCTLISSSEDTPFVEFWVSLQMSGELEGHIH